VIARPSAVEAAERAMRRVTEGARFVWLFCEAAYSDRTLHYVTERDGKLEFFNGAVPESGEVASVAGVTPAARWHEQEVHHRFGVRFAGSADHPPIIKSPEQDAEKLRRALGDEVSTVLYGPIRSGIVESACWIIETAGEDFIAVHPSMFFKHRGLEKRFEGATLELAPFVAEHISGVTPSSHAAAFCRAVETVCGIDVPPRARAARTILVELERIHQHLDSLAKLADDGSLSIGAAQTFAAKERVHRLLAHATGHRFGRGSICVGGMRSDVFGRLRKAAEGGLDIVEREALAVLRGLFGTQSLLDRLIGTGRLSREITHAYGGVGPVARGSGIVNDARLMDGWLYAPLDAPAAIELNGDAMARARIREAEIRQSFRLVREALDAAPTGASRVDLQRIQGKGEAYARVESPQGELLYFVRYEEALVRVAVRSASFANWPLFVPSLPGNIFTDFSFIEHSFGLVQSETDR
jgi:Ni,Fe-hydrogenase III large subunit